jgi:hypothetical protein
MNGLELCRRYFEECGGPTLRREFPEIMDRAAVGLVGEGSECLGFDDELSRDHDFGPGFCIWLSREDAERYGRELQAAYEQLPRDFLGVRRLETRRGAGRVGVMELHSFFGRFMGAEQPPKNLRRWLNLPEHFLCLISGGEVFQDPSGEFSRIRDAVRAYYPEDVRIKKIAARAAEMSRAGQYNYGRAMRRGDLVSASLALADFLRSSMRMIYLCNFVYAPYDKWLYRGLTDLRDGKRLIFGPQYQPPMRLSGAVPLLGELSRLRPDGSFWGSSENLPDVNLKDPCVQRIEEICRLTLSELRREGLTDGSDVFLERHTWNIMAKIQDQELARCHVLEG